ncbi:MAG: PPOX class probable F420-dependent enzyme [Patiriisocius sp.]|jgi:PPOX class probable F420-dependent enzyme
MSDNSFDVAAATYVNLVTFRKTGAEVRTPVWIAPLDGKHYVFSESKAGKVKRINNNPSVKIALCDMRGKLLGTDWIDGQAAVITDTKLIKAVNGSFTQKYGLIMRATNLLAQLSGRYHKRAMLEITLGG